MVARVFGYELFNGFELGDDWCCWGGLIMVYLWYWILVSVFDFFGVLGLIFFEFDLIYSLNIFFGCFPSVNV